MADAEASLVDENTSEAAAFGGQDESLSTENKITQQLAVADEVSIPERCSEMLKTVADYVNGELSVTCEDYKLLERLNKLSTTKYQEMSSLTNALIGSMDSVKNKYLSLQPYLDQIDHLEESVTKLEESASKLDAYSKQLESKFKRIEKK